VVTYLVQVQFNPGKLPVKVGMSANADIQVEQHEGVLQVPNRAIKSQGPVKTLQVLYGKTQTPINVPVRTGATNGTMTEVVGCLETGNQCLREGDKVAMELPGVQDSSTGGPGMGDTMFISGPAKGGGPGGGTVIFQNKVPGP